MASEERVTTKGIAAGILPQIVKAREDLDTSLASLQYLWTVVDKRPADRVATDVYGLVYIQAMIRELERGLSLMAGSSAARRA